MAPVAGDDAEGRGAGDDGEGPGLDRRPGLRTPPRSANAVSPVASTTWPTCTSRRNSARRSRSGSSRRIASLPPMPATTTARQSANAVVEKLHPDAAWNAFTST